ncbi:hypothetical protein SDC9_145935 [bioreactor metagenome]|uniref:Uncharacterized protein n=1 Tax=bioreactor metagenome TaxID=1076179 RepID=A0A645EB87_9ZZZZ
MSIGKLSFNCSLIFNIFISSTVVSPYPLLLSTVVVPELSMLYSLLAAVLYKDSVEAFLVISTVTIIPVLIPMPCNTFESSVVNLAAYSLTLDPPKTK